MTASRTLAVLSDGIERGLHPGAQIYVSLRGEIVLDQALGESLPNVPMSRDSINLWMSSVKPLAGIATAMLRERGKLAYDDPVARHVPEFAQNGKDAITIHHLLTHTGGFRAMPDAWLNEPWETIIANICAMRPEPGWKPGEKAGYHPRTAWFMLAEIVRRIDGRPYDRFARQDILQPLSMRDSWIGMPSDRYHEYLRDNRLAAMVEADKPDSFAAPTERQCTAVRPGSNGRGPMRELGLFYEWMLRAATPASHALLAPDSIAQLVRPHRVGLFDHTFKHVMDWGLGFMLNTRRDPDMPYTFGRHASARAFGHSGAQSSCAFADPEHDLVVSWVCNGMPGEEAHQIRQRAINEAIYDDLLSERSRGR